MSQTILLIEDEVELANAVAFALRREGYQVKHAETGRGALEIAERSEVHLAVVDLMLPDISGVEVCRTLRNVGNPQMGIIIVTAKNAEIDRVVGFESGADDYVSKPFSMRELILRIRAILRRQQSQQEGSGDIITDGDVVIDTIAHEVRIQGQPVHLTVLEFKLLKTFVERKGRLQTRERLLSDVWGIDADITTRTVDTHVKRLREKIGTAGDYIETLRGVGYRWRVPE